MGLIKRTPADAAFSDCVRERANWACEKCNKYYPIGHRFGLSCSHHHKRGNWSIRFDPTNGESLCTGCHYLVGGTEERRQLVLTKEKQELLLRKKADTALGKKIRRTGGIGLIAAHYRSEYRRMRELRAQGETGRIDFSEWIPE